MKKKLIILSVAAVTLLVSIQPSLAGYEVVYAPNDDVLLMMSYSQAKRRIESMENRGTYCGVADDLFKDIKISSDKVMWRTVRSDGDFWQLYTSYFKSMKIDVVPRLTSEHGMGYWVRVGRLKCEHHQPRAAKTLTECFGDYFVVSSSEDESVSLAAAFYVLKRYAEGYKPENELASAAFANEAKRYCEMPVKPALSEDVQQYRIMAEDAFKNKDFDKALEYYRKGLAIEPLWPQGQFNAAMLAGELHQYNWATLYMKRYLELVPDAANANAAREKMYLWKGKAKEEQQKLTGAGG